jgi:serine/threonine-protein kinase
VLDFGISKISALSEPTPAITHTQTLLGSPLYMPPEQMRSARNADARSDIWSLGILLHELVAGKPPFNGSTVAEVLTQVLDAAPPNLSTLVPGVPPGLAAVVERCLQKDPARRFADVAELANALLPFAPLQSHSSVQRISRVLLGAGHDETDADRPFERVSRESLPVAGTGASWGGTHSGSVRPSPRRVILAGAGVLVLTVGALLLWSRTSSEVPAGPPSAVWTASATHPPPAAASLSEPSVVPVPSATAAAKPAETAPGARPAGERGVRADRAGRNARSAAAASPPVRDPADPKPPSPKAPHAIDPFEDR